MADTPEKQARRMERGRKLLGFVDPAAAANMPSLHDAAGGATGALREADRDYKQIRLTESLLAEQQETNRLLRALLERP